MNLNILLAKTGGLFAAVLCGWAIGAAGGAVLAFALSMSCIAVPLRGSPLSTWACRYARRKRRIRFDGLATVSHDGSSAGVRCSNGIAIAAVQVLGKPHEATRLTGSRVAETNNTLDVTWLIPALKQSLGITLDSISVVIAGSRRNRLGDYPRIYDALVGPSSYAGRRETWLLLRLPDLPNGEALQWRTSLGAAAVACAKRTAAMLGERGLRARVATAGEISEFELRMGRDALEPQNRHWDALRNGTGWLTTYTYRNAVYETEKFCQAWRWQADSVIQNVTLLHDGTATVTVTVGTNQRQASAPSTSLQKMPGEQAGAAALNLCVARQDLGAVPTRPWPRKMIVPVGQSGVLIGRYRSGGRMLLPLSDPAEESRVHIAAVDGIAHRLVMRLAGSGERITVHTNEIERWKRLRMTNLLVTDEMRPADGTTVSVVDGTVSPVPRPQTIISVGTPRGPAPPADVLMEQIGPQTLRVTAAGVSNEVDIEMFRAEKPFLPVDVGNQPIVE